MIFDFSFLILTHWPANHGLWAAGRVAEEGKERIMWENKGKLV